MIMIIWVRKGDRRMRDDVIMMAQEIQLIINLPRDLQSLANRHKCKECYSERPRRS